MTKKKETASEELSKGYHDMNELFEDLDAEDNTLEQDIETMGDLADMGKGEE